MKITVPVPALTGGVSTQPEPVRLPQQADRSDNFIATVVEGLRTRPPTEYLASLASHPATACAYHPITQVNDDYVIAMNSSSLQVYNLNNLSSPVVVRGPSGSPITLSDLSYLSGVVNPQEDLRFLTIEDYTLVVNTRRTVAAKSTTTPLQASKGLVFIKVPAYSTSYQVRIRHNNVLYRFEYVTPNTGSPNAEPQVKTQAIALVLKNIMTLGSNASIPSGGTASWTGILDNQTWEVLVAGSTIAITNRNGEDFYLTTTDGQGDTAISSIHKEVQLFSDLPTRAPHGMRIKVLGDPSQPDAAFWAEFVMDEGTAVGAIGEGTWEESAAPNISLGLDPTTMPHALIRQSNGEFRWTPLDGSVYVVSGQNFPVESWANRTVGDDTSNAHPRFVGRTINALCYHEGRMGVLSDDALTFSESASPFNFYRTTVVDVLDSERVELEGRNEVEKMRHAVPLGADVLIFAQDAQLVVRADGPLTPSSASLVRAARYDSSPEAEPVVVRDSVFVATERSGKAAIHEFRVVGDQRPEIQQADVTAIASSYVPRIRQMATTPQVDLVVALSDDEPDAMYVYTHYWQNQEKVAQAWQRFLLADSPSLLYAWFDGTILYILARYSSGVRLLKMRMSHFETDGANGFLNLDCRVDITYETKTYDGKNTTFTLPYPATANTAVVNYESFKVVRVVSYTGNTIVLGGDQRSTKLWLGGLYDVRHDMSRAYVAGPDSAPVMSEDLYLDGGVIYYDRSGPFEVHVVNDFGQDWFTVFGGPGLGIGANYQTVRPTSGRFPFGIRSKADSCRISFRARQPWPVRLISMDIYGRLNRNRGQRP